MTRPPITAVRRVDFRRQNDIVIGDIKSETAVDIAPSHPVNKKGKLWKLLCKKKKNLKYVQGI